MRILFLTDNFPPEVNAPATRTYEHCKEWVQQGAEVTVITCVPNFPKGKVFGGYKNRWKQTEFIDGIRVVRVWSFIAANKGFLKRTIDFISFSITSFLAGLLIKSDVIVATSPQFFTALSGKALSFFKRTPWVMEVRDLWPESIKTVGAMKDNLVIKYFEYLEKKCYKSASKIITVTDSFKREIVHKGIEEDKISVIKNGSNLVLFQPVEKNYTLIKQLGLEGKIILGYIGTHGMAHNLDFILNCAKNIKDENIHFLLIGDGAEKNRLQNRVIEESISNVTMLEAINKKSVPNYLSILDIAIVNLKKDKLFTTVIPSKIFETAAMGIPILLGVDGESREIIEHYNAGVYYDPDSIEEFNQALSKIMNAKRNSFSANAIKLSMDFDRKKLAKRMFSILSNV